MKLHMVAVSLLLSTSAGFAADIPNMVGTWKPTGDLAAAFAGAYPVSEKKLASPIFDAKGNQWTLRIDVQDGRAFAGVSIGPDGKEFTLAGVLRADLKRFVYSNDRGIASGEVMGDTIEVCWTDVIEKVAGASCGTYKK